MNDLAGSPALLLRIAPLIQVLFIATPGLADPDLARRHYESALDALKAGELRQAQDSFEAAYRASPHYLVLYNLGRVSFELGEHDQAREYFERYLEQGGDAISPEEREQALAMIAKTRADATPREEIRALEPSRETPPVASTTTASPSPVVREPPPAARSRKSVAKAELARERQATLAVTLGTTGAVISAVGAGMLLWNDGRRDDYEAEQQELRVSPPSEVDSQDDLDRVVAHAKAQERNQANLESVQRVDTFALATLGVGAALVATGVVLYLTRTDEASVAVGTRQTELFVRVRY